jgi:hypothetical protein
MNINKDLFYTRVDIEKLSEIIGASVWDRNEFKTYVTQTHKFKSKPDQEFVCIENPKK